MASKVEVVGGERETVFAVWHAECMKIQSQFHMLNADGQSPSKSDPLVMCKPLRHPTFASGQLIIRPLHTKRNQFVRNDTLVCQRLST